MARKKSTDEVVPEVTDVVIEESVVEEKPKATKKKKAAEKVEEEPVVAAVPEVVEEPIAEIPVEPEKIEEVPVVEEKPKKVKKVKAEKVEDPAPVVEEVKVEAPISDFPYKAKVTASIIHSRKGPGMSFHTARDLYKGTMVVVSAIEGNWGKIGKDLWVNINYIEKI